MKKMSPKVRAEYDILAAEMDQSDHLKIKLHEYSKKNGTKDFTVKMNNILAAFLVDRCRPWREIPRARKKILRAARVLTS